MAAARILLIEDDRRLAEMVSEYLGEAGFRVAVAGDGRTGLAHLASEPYDALILDLMLPDMDGLELCRRLRATSDTPVLMLTARGDALDRVVGLEVGADDYLPKPFEPRELLARLRAILRRRGRAALPPSCASAAWRSIATRAACAWTGRSAVSPATSSRSCWRSPSGRAASCPGMP